MLDARCNRSPYHSPLTTHRLPLTCQGMTEHNGTNGNGAPWGMGSYPGPGLPAAPLRIALYSHDAMGIGHLRRNQLIARALADAPLKATVLLIAGAREAGLFPLASGLDCLTLPSLSKDLNGRYGSRSLHLDLRHLVRLRSEVIRAAIDEFQPHLLIVDKLPRGALNELDDALEHVKSRSTTRCVLGLRDVLDEPEVVRREWQTAANEEVIQRYFDAVWVYGDPAVYNAAVEYGFSPRVAAKVRYTGYFDQRARIAYAEAAAAPDPLQGLGLPPGRLTLCLVGGGQDGEALADAFSRAPLPRDMNAVLLAGPYLPRKMSATIRSRTAGSRFRLVDFVAEPELLFSRADRVVAMGGYNTVCEILSFEKPALIVPRIKPRREQVIRAARLRDLGLLQMLLPEEATPERIGAWLKDDVRPPAALDRLDFSGLSRVPELVSELLGPLAAAPAPTLSQENCLVPA